MSLDNVGRGKQYKLAEPVLARLNARLSWSYTVS